jgi:uncharacterized protein (DUF924 family)
MNARVHAILAFWFGAHLDGEMRREWFQSTPAFDADIRKQFAEDYEKAKAGIYDAWLDEPKSCLALIILLDQFPRNLFRGSAQSFATDGAALKAAQHGVAHGHDTQLHPVERMFLYLPFEHSEDMAMQTQSLELFRALQGIGPVALQHAERHYDEIKRFGRFPYRNAALGRVSTAGEEKYVEELSKALRSV